MPNNPTTTANRRAGNGARDALDAWIDTVFDTWAQVLETQRRAAKTWADAMGPLYDVVGEATTLTQRAIDREDARK